MHQFETNGFRFGVSVDKVVEHLEAIIKNLKEGNGFITSLQSTEDYDNSDFVQREFHMRYSLKLNKENTK